MLVPKFKGLDSINVFNVQGRTNTAEGNTKFQEDIKHLLETPIGTVLGNLTYGSNLYRILFMPARESTGTLIQEEIKSCIERNYTGIVVESVDVSYDNRTFYVKIGLNNNNSNVLQYIDLDFAGGEN